MKIDNNRTAIGDKLKWLRRHNGYTLQQVANMSGFCNRSKVAQLEAGICLTYGVIKKMARFYSYDLDKLLNLGKLVKHDDPFMSVMRFRMRKYNLSIQDISEKCKVRKDTVRNWIRGYTLPKEKKANDLAEIFHCDYCKIMDAIEESKMLRN